MARNRIEELTARPLRTAEDIAGAPFDDDAMPPKPEAKAVVEDRPTTYSFPEPLPFIPPLSSNNREKLERLKEHFEKLFVLAQTGIIEGVRFYGDTTIRVSWQDGQAQSLHPTIASQDRVGR